MERITNTPAGVGPILITAAILLIAAGFYYTGYRTTAYFIVLLYALIFLTAFAYVVFISARDALTENRKQR